MEVEGLEVRVASFHVLLLLGRLSEEAVLFEVLLVELEHFLPIVAALDAVEYFVVQLLGYIAGIG